MSPPAAPPLQPVMTLAPRHLLGIPIGDAALDAARRPPLERSIFGNYEWLSPGWP